MSSRRAALEAVIDADPASLDNYLVLADHLLEEGDPRAPALAALARLELVRARRGLAFDGEMSAREQAVILEAGLAAGLPPELALTWCAGYVKTAELTMDYETRESYRPLLDGFLAHPSARFLQEVALGIISLDDPGDYQEAIDALVARGPASLRVFRIADADYSDYGEWASFDDLTAFLARFPRLERLFLRCTIRNLGADLALPRLRSLILRSWLLDARHIRAVAEADWPVLEELELFMGQVYRGSDERLALLQPIIQGTRLPALRRLGLTNSPFGDEICALLVASPLLPRLERLDLSRSALTDRGARTLGAHGDRLAHLLDLDLSHCFLTDAGKRAVDRIGVPVQHGWQRTGAPTTYR
jgi:uncharacterized protein (TIGR02996 family)